MSASSEIPQFGGAPCVEYCPVQLGLLAATYAITISNDLSGEQKELSLKLTQPKVDAITYLAKKCGNTDVADDPTGYSCSFQEAYDLAVDELEGFEGIFVDADSGNEEDDPEEQSTQSSPGELDPDHEQKL